MVGFRSEEEVPGGVLRPLPTVRETPTEVTSELKRIFFSGRQVDLRSRRRLRCSGQTELGEGL